jgi:hypothetical protein
MTFVTTAFGTGLITTPGNMVFTKLGSIPSGGFRLFIVPTKNTGPNGIDIGFTYVNQFGVLKITSVTTAVAPSTTAGTHVQVVLEAGDTGIRELMGATINPTGGTTTDSLSFESWNEGLGRPPYDISKTDPFDRTLPGAYVYEPYIGLWKGIDYPLSNVIPTPWYVSPSIPIPIQVFENRAPITGWLPDVIIDRQTMAIIWNLVDNIGARKELVSWIPEPLSGRDITGKIFFVFKSWLESVVGQVLSGYVQSVNGEVIKNAFSMILMSTTPTETSPGGSSTTADINPDTGLYQAFLKKVVYDSRYLIVKIGIKNVALEGAGIPTVVDGNQQLPLPYNLQFACPVKNCDFTITRRIT